MNTEFTDFDVTEIYIPTFSYSATKYTWLRSEDENMLQDEERKRTSSHAEGENVKYTWVRSDEDNLTQEETRKLLAETAKATNAAERFRKWKERILRETADIPSGDDASMDQ
jgi:hypothetical protein